MLRGEAVRERDYVYRGDARARGKRGAYHVDDGIEHEEGYHDEDRGDDRLDDDVGAEWFFHISPSLNALVRRKLNIAKGASTRKIMTAITDA